MKVSEIREIALGLIGVTEDIKWNDHLCFSVGDKMFLVTNPDLVPSTASFKVADDIFYETLTKQGFSKHQYLGRYCWIHLYDINRSTEKNWSKYIKESYELVASKLSNKTRSKLKIKNTI